MTLLDQNLGQLARTIPGATAVFHKHHLDFCCAGKQSLREAAAARALYLGLETLKIDLMDHIHLENNILFDRIDGQLGEKHDA